MKRLFFLPLIAAFLLAACTADTEANPTPAKAAAVTDTTETLPAVTVYKSPTCTCCSRWVTHLKQNGFEIENVVEGNVAAAKDSLGVPPELRSCHTAVVAGEVIEGHVPAEVIKQYLRHDAERAAGLAVPGMPVGSPGMEVPGRPAESYEVIAFTADGRASVYARR